MAKKQKKAHKKTVKPAKKAAPRASSIGVRPVGDKVLIKPEVFEEKTESGLIMPDTAKKEKMMSGTVVALGTGRVSENGARLPLSVSLGDKVYFSRGWDEEGSKFPWKGEDYYLVSESDIKAIIS